MKTKEEKHDLHKKLRILAAADIHGDTGLAEKLAEKAKKEHVDLVILCGDLTMADQSTDNLVGPFTIVSLIHSDRITRALGGGSLEKPTKSPTFARMTVAGSLPFSILR